MLAHLRARYRLVLKLCWPIFEARLVHPGAMLAQLGPILGRLRAMLGRLGREVEPAWG